MSSSWLELPCWWVDFNFLSAWWFFILSAETFKVKCDEKMEVMNIGLFQLFLLLHYSRANFLTFSFSFFSPTDYTYLIWDYSTMPLIFLTFFNWCSNTVVPIFPPPLPPALPVPTYHPQSHPHLALSMGPSFMFIKREKRYLLFPQKPWEFWGVDVEMALLVMSLTGAKDGGWYCPLVSSCWGWPYRLRRRGMADIHGL